MISLQESQQIIAVHSASFGRELVALNDVYERVLSEDIRADRAYPPFNRAAMDGYAIRWMDFVEKGVRSFRIIDEIYAGDNTIIDSATEGDAVKIMTGAATPECFDAIIRVEDTENERDNRVRFLCETIKKGQNIAQKGEDAQEGSLVLAKGTQLFGPEMGVLATVGKSDVWVEKLPEIALFSTGNEVKSVSEMVLPFQIRDSNRYALEGLLKKYQCQIAINQLLRDEKEGISKAISDASEADIIILTGGVSAGDADYVPTLLKELGYKELFHKVKIKPGKPFWFGTKGKTTVFALPGNPMSCQVGFKLFLEPFLRQCFGIAPYPIYTFPLCEGRSKKVKLDEFFPCQIIENQLIEVKTNGSGDIRAAIGSVGLSRHPLESDSLKKGELVEFFFW